MFSYFCAHTFHVSFVSFLRHFQDGLSKKKNVLVRSSTNLKSFLNGRFTFLMYLKMITWISKLLFFFLPQFNTHKFRFQLRDTFFHCLFFPFPLALFQGFLSNQIHVATILSDSWKLKVPQLILYMNCYFSQEHHMIA